MFSVPRQVLAFVCLPVILICTGGAFAQMTSPTAYDPSRRFSPQELQKDFLIFRKALEESYPGLYRYASKNVMDRNFAKAFQSISKEMTEREFLGLVKLVVSSIKCGHTEGNPSKDFDNYIEHSAKQFPLQLRFINGKAYVVASTNKEIVKGCELRSINGTRMPEITQTLMQYLNSDGDIQTGKYWQLSEQFGYYYYLLIGQPTSFNVKCYNQAKKEITATQLPALTTKEIRELLRPGVITEISGNPKPLRFELLPQSNIAVLAINTFSEKRITRADQDFPEFLKSSFLEIKDKNVQDLIIDLRGNTGGADRFGALLFSYLTNRDFRYFDYVEAATNNFSFLEYTNAGPDFTRDFAATIEPDSRGRYRLKEQYTPQLSIQKPADNNYEKRMWFLINGKSFSTAADFSAVARSHGRGPFVGEETGGAYYGNNSGQSLFLTLPTTKVRVLFHLYKYVNAVSPAPHHARGVLPDYPVQPTIFDVLNRVDTELNYTLKLIRQAHKHIQLPKCS